MNTRWQAALLIARREFLEHVRTRGFWLSLGTVPLILLLSLAIPVASELSRPDLSFAVTDRSGWLLNKIVRDADASDLERILGRAEREGENDALAALRRHWRVEHPAALAARVDALLTGPADDVERAFLDWYRRLDPPAARRIDLNSNMDRRQPLREDGSRSRCTSLTATARDDHLLPRRWVRKQSLPRACESCRASAPSM